MKKLLRFMVVPLRIGPNRANRTYLNSVILALEVESPDLIFISAVFVGFSLRFEFDAPAACDHLAAHLAVFSRAQRHVREVGIFDRLLFDVRGVDVQAPGQVFLGVLDCGIFIDCHTRFKRPPWILCSGD